jgi:hypothetical protein
MHVSQATEASPSWIKVNRLKDSYTWNVQVGAESNSIEGLRIAKDKAVAVGQELQASLSPPIAEEEAPF